MRKVTMLHVGNTHNKTLQSGLCRGKPFDTKDILRISLPSQPLGQRTNEQKQTTWKNTQLNKSKHNKHNK